MRGLERELPVITAGREDKEGPDQAVFYILRSFIQTARKRADLAVPVLLLQAEACCSGSAVFWCYLLSSGKIKILFLQAVRQPLRLEGSFPWWCITAAFILKHTPFCHPCGERGLID